MFDLERAIDAWTRSLRRKGAVGDGDRAELEDYLREKVAELAGQGLSEADAFRQAAALFADGGPLDEEYEAASARPTLARRLRRFMPDLVWNYGMVAWRRVRRDKGYVAVAVGGLALALTVALTILIWARYEWSYDRFHRSGSEIHRFIYHRVSPAGGATDDPYLPEALAVAIPGAFPEIRCSVRIGITPRDFRLETPRLVDLRSRVLFAGPEFLSMFNFPLASGDRGTALSRPRSVVLTESSARRFFGPDDPLGRTLLAFRDKIPVTVTGVLRDLPANSHLDFDLVFPWVDQLLAGDYLANGPWSVHPSQLFVQLDPRADPAALAAKATRLAQDDPRPGRRGLTLQPLFDIHLHPERVSYDLLSRRGPVDWRQMAIFLAAAAAVLLMGCLNYANLAAARSLKRAAEIGVRKANGATRGDIVRQFLGESILFAALAMAVATAGAVAAGLPAMGKLTRMSLRVSLLPAGELAAGLAALTLLIGLLGGLYPALFISSFPPIQALKQRFAARQGTFLRARRALVAVQVFCAAALVGVVFAFTLQIRFLERKDLGYRPSGLVMIPGSPDGDRLPAYRTAVLAHPAVLDLAVGLPPFLGPSGHAIGSDDFSWEGASDDDRFPLDWLFADERYLETYGLTLTAGRWFSGDMATDASAFVVTESAAAAMGLREPVGTRVRFWKTDGRIIGVVKDFHAGTLKAPIRPLLFRYSRVGAAMARIDPRATEAALRHLASVCRDFDPEAPFEYSFLDDRLRGFYAADRLTARIVLGFGSIAILVSCLGLFGLVSFAAEQRTKEIGIRKILGASGTRIVRMMATDFSGLVGVVVLAAGPLAWWISRRWLESFAYRIHLGPWIFALAGLLVFGLALGTMSLRAVRAAAGDPVEALRYE